MIKDTLNELIEMLHKGPNKKDLIRLKDKTVWGEYYEDIYKKTMIYKVHPDLTYEATYLKLNRITDQEQRLTLKTQKKHKVIEETTQRINNTFGEILTTQTTNYPNYQTAKQQYFKKAKEND